MNYALSPALDEIIRLTVAVARSGEPTTTDYFELLNRRNELVRNIRAALDSVSALLKAHDAETAISDAESIGERHDDATFFAAAWKTAQAAHACRLSIADVMSHRPVAQSSQARDATGCPSSYRARPSEQGNSP